MSGIIAVYGLVVAVLLSGQRKLIIYNKSPAFFSIDSFFCVLYTI